jgi:serine/threonine protein phosphatase PrpC
VTQRWRSGVCSDAGLVRPVNEDRYYIDDERGIFAVVDGVGGNAAGETAAEIAIEVIRAELSGPDRANPDGLRQAITAANNEIHRRASANESWHGMACVLTIAVVNHERVILGHVGDSRLYLIWNGSIRKLTCDHSPVGELEDKGELSEEEAMVHPRRHEVFRDVGSRPHSPGDEEFIDTREFVLKPDAAMLLSSDGLTDLLTSGQIHELVEKYEGDPDRTAEELIDAANDAGGTDNVTAIFVAGAEFVGGNSSQMNDARQRHGITRDRSIAKKALFSGRVSFLIYGLLIGLLIGLLLALSFR